MKYITVFVLTIISLYITSLIANVSFYNIPYSYILVLCVGETFGLASGFILTLFSHETE